jgi:alkylated DNA repair dioxygenase AlkB
MATPNKNSHLCRSENVLSDYVDYIPSAIRESTANQFLACADKLFTHERSIIKVFGREHKVPRDQVVLNLGNSNISKGVRCQDDSFDDTFSQDNSRRKSSLRSDAFSQDNSRRLDAFSYRYSNQTVLTRPCTPEVMTIQKEVETMFMALYDQPISYNFVLINRYLDGKDSVGWHADNEESIDQTMPICSVSFGSARDFDVRMKNNHSFRQRWNLKHRDLLIMKPGAQELTEHCLPKRANSSVRFNLTFRVNQPTFQKTVVEDLTPSQKASKTKCLYHDNQLETSKI